MNEIGLIDTMAKVTQYLTFMLEEEIFALDISQVREVLEYTKSTKVPRTPEYMIGVINLRGSVVPVVDMRNKFRLKPMTISVDTCIIILEISIEGEESVIGALVDSVREVIELEPNQMEPPPKIGSKLNTDYIKNMGKINGDFIIILDVDKVFSLDELTTVKAITSNIEEA
ncbi:MAG: chemotaxis protein CheW [Candidatus Margulisbacteria bacterium GWF2_35_9]|nr:MAG: chemotaxis protein CheW [Candidatus Margulisbacteria bacterium GWF2_35_9]